MKKLSFDLQVTKEHKISFPFTSRISKGELSVCHVNIINTIIFKKGQMRV